MSSEPEEEEARWPQSEAWIERTPGYGLARYRVHFRESGSYHWGESTPTLTLRGAVRLANRAEKRHDREQVA